MSDNLILVTEDSWVVYAVKLYPAGATTNSQDGMTDLFGKCLPVLQEMAKQNMPLLDETWVAGGSEILLRSTNGGKSWTRDKATDNIAANLYFVK
ncbi:dihydroorotase, mitochondrial-like [Silene latifolia]|uniref:dihydroorotase, mitochondrial-like n=1 Tax=Silene latifolia TaxID=37657 RepID=UPI003D776578